MGRLDEMRDWINGRLDPLVLHAIDTVPRLETSVVGIDGSDDAQNAAAWAAKLTPQTHLVFAEARSYPRVGSTPESMQTLAEDARMAFDLVRLEVETIHAKEHVLDAFPARAIVNIADDVQADLIITGPRQWAIEEEGMGNVSQTLVHHAPYPVLLAREAPTTGPVLATLGPDRASRSAAAWAVRLADVLQEPLVAVHAAPRDLERIDLADFEDEGPQREARLLDPPTEDAILDVVDELEPSVLVTGHGRHHDWLGSTAITLLERAPCSVLVAPTTGPGLASTDARRGGAR